MKGKYIGIDIGGTNLKGVVIENDRMIYSAMRPTFEEQHHWQNSVRAFLKDLDALHPLPLERVGISAPGIADPTNQYIAYMPGRLQGLENFDWHTFLGAPVKVLNDAHAALWAEASWGAGKNIKNIVLITLGTGVGGGLLINGQLYQGFLQRAGHLGHLAIDASFERPDITGIPGSLEDAIGEATLAERSLGKFHHTADLVAAYQQGDTWATYIWLTSVRKLALGIASCCNALSPECIVLGGGIAKAGDALLDPLRTFLDLYEWRPNGSITPIHLAHFEEFAGAMGAALFAAS